MVVSLTHAQFLSVEQYTIYCGTFLFCLSFWPVIFAGKVVKRLSIKGKGGVDSATCSWLCCAFGNLLLIVALCVAVFFPLRSLNSAPACAILFLACSGLCFVLSAPIVSGTFLAVALVVHSPKRARRAALVCVGVVCCWSAGLPLALTVASGNTDAYFSLCLSCLVVASTTALVAVSVSQLAVSALIATITVMEKTFLTDTSGKVFTLKRVIVAFRSIQMICIVGMAGLTWEGVLIFLNISSSPQRIAATTLWLTAIVGLCTVFLIFLSEGEATESAAEVFKAHYVGVVDLEQAYFELFPLDIRTEAKECRRVPLHLAEDLPFWIRFSRMSVSWSNIFLFPHPIDSWFSKLHAVFTSVELLIATLFMMLNYLCQCQQFNVATIVIFSFMLAGFACRMLTGAMIDVQAWTVVFLIKFLRRHNVIKPELQPGPPKRFTQAVACVMIFIQLVLYICGYQNVTIWILGLHFALSVGNMFGCCAGCATFHLMVLIGLAPKSWCAACEIEFRVLEKSKTNMVLEDQDQEDDDDDDVFSIESQFESSSVQVQTSTTTK